MYRVPSFPFCKSMLCPPQDLIKIPFFLFSIYSYKLLILQFNDMFVSFDSWTRSRHISS